MEELSHVPLFFTLFKTIIEENFNGVVPEDIVTKAHEMIKTAAEAEKRWTKYASNGLLGFTDKSISVFVENRANRVCSNLKLPKLYPHVENDPLGKLLKDRLKGGDYESRSNFFEVNPTEYSKGQIEDDY